LVKFLYSDDVKRLVFLKPAYSGLCKYKNMAPRIREKLAVYAAGPASLAKQMPELQGSALKRLRVGDFRVLSEETETEIIVTEIGPRGSIYD
jgi:mRNA interferase RelE/StbE